MEKCECCYDTKCKSEFVNFVCKSKHKICFKCLLKYIETDINNKFICFFCRGGCDYVIIDHNTTNDTTNDTANDTTNDTTNGTINDITNDTTNDITNEYYTIKFFISSLGTHNACIYNISIFKNYIQKYKNLSNNILQNQSSSLYINQSLIENYATYNNCRPGTSY